MLATFLSLVYFWIKRIKNREQKRREALEIQNRLLQLEQKALQLQMNPHFIFNALNSIQSLIVTQDYGVARQEINHFAKLMRGILNNSRKTSISLKEEIETLEEYLHIEQFCQKNPFTFTVKTSDAIDPENLEIPPMLLQPFVENAVIHGVSTLNYEGHIEVFFDTNEDVLTCRVRDNGIGREKTALLQEARKSGHQSVALSVTQERLTAIGGSLVLQDILDANGKVCGTEAIIRLKV
jgi:sensor histidine kinase YesM